MENKLLDTIRRYEMVQPGDTVICAVSGGADSMALLWGMHLLAEKLGIQVRAAHFNHHLRGMESDRDEGYVRAFCEFHDIPLHVGFCHVTAGKKGLEAAARDARYAFLRKLPGIIATAHTADDNAETVLMHLIRGSGLRGLGGITPKAPGLIRPMLDITRQEVEAFLQENWISYIHDSSNDSDAFLRNRLRHHVMPLLLKENPSLNENLSAMAQRLRQDEQIIESLVEDTSSVIALRKMELPVQRRALERFLRSCGVKEPESQHIEQLRNLVLTPHPSAQTRFPGDVIIRRNYDRLEVGAEREKLLPRKICTGQSVDIEEAELIFSATEHCPKEAGQWVKVYPAGEMEIRSRMPGDEITLSGGTKSLKKLFIDRKIPAHERPLIPVVADGERVLYVWGIGANQNCNQENVPIWIRFEKKSHKEK